MSDISDLQKVLKDKQKRGVLLNALLNKSRTTSIQKREAVAQPNEKDLDDILAELN